MKHLTIVIPEGENNLSSIVGAYKIFKRANAFVVENGREVVFDIKLAGISSEVDFYKGLFAVRPHCHVSSISKTDLIIVPSLNHNYDKAIESNSVLIEWMYDQNKKGAEIASICTGAFLLASTGLLDGKQCSTHWATKEVFGNLFPEVILKTDRIITDENGIYTNGGAYSFLNLIIYLVEKFYGRETAIYCSKVFQIDLDRKSQSEFVIFSGQKSHADDMVKQAQTYIESHYQEKFTAEQLSAIFSSGRRNFDRRFIKATGNTPLEYLQRVKIESAKKAFEDTRKTVSEVMYAVGYSDIKAFREIFRRITGISPFAYKAKYNKETTVKNSGKNVRGVG